MSSPYKGLISPDYADPADAPLAFQQFIDSGPIPRFANASARTAAIPAPTKGQVTYRLDTSVVEIYNGSVWQSVNPVAPPPHTHKADQITTDLLYSQIASVNPDVLTKVVPNSKLPNASTTAQGVVQLSNSESSVSEVVAPTMKALTGLRQDAVLKTGNHVMTGTLATAGGNATTPGIRVGPEAGIYSDTSNAVEMTTGPGGVNFRLSGNAPGFLPGKDNQLHLGGSSYRFRDVYATDGTINTSDPSQKDISSVVGSVLSKMAMVRPIRFTWKTRPTEPEHFGFDATELLAAFPEVVIGSEGNLAVRERDLIAILWAAVLELRSRLAT